MSLESILRARETAVRAVAEKKQRMQRPAVIREEKTKMQRDFERFHQINPDVYDSLVDVAREVMAEVRSHGGKKIGLRMCWETMRFRTKRYLAPTDDRQGLYRLNDHYCPYYARLIMEREPDLADAFEIRRLRSADPTTVDREHRPVG